MKVMNHAEYQRRLKGKSSEELRYIIQDAREAIAANPTGKNAGYYQDEIHYANAELSRQNKQERQTRRQRRQMKAFA